MTDAEFLNHTKEFLYASTTVNWDDGDVERLMTLAGRGIGKEWMPIESAPKDGGFVILISQHDGKFGRPYFGNFDCGWLHSDGDPVRPSHYMPLPSPPEAPTGKGVGE